MPATYEPIASQTLGSGSTFSLYGIKAAHDVTNL
jgi:hypothetical protein